MIDMSLFVISLISRLALIFFLIIGPFSQSAFAGEVKGLKEIYGTPIPLQIRRNFDQAIQTRKICPECTLGIVDGDKYFYIFSKRFFVVGFESNPFGGFWVVIAVEGELKNAFVLWLYDISDEEYDLRFIDKIEKSLDEALIRQLSEVAYNSYWL